MNLLTEIIRNENFFKNNLPGLRLMKINKVPTESCRFICKCENRNKGFAPFSAKFVDNINSDSEKIRLRFAYKIVTSWR